MLPENNSFVTAEVASLVDSLQLTVPSIFQNFYKRAETVYGGVRASGHAGRPVRKNHLIGGSPRMPKVEVDSHYPDGLRGSACRGCPADTIMPLIPVCLGSTVTNLTLRFETFGIRQMALLY